MDVSSELLTLKEDKLASIRSRNKTLIIAFFALIIVLALITGHTITSLVQQINSKSIKSNRAVLAFCSPYKYRPACIDSISAAANPWPDATPSQVFLLSLESSVAKISGIVTAARSEPGLSGCASSLSHAAGQLGSILEVLRVDPDVESYDRRNITAWIGAAAADLAACAELLGKAESSAEVAVRVADVAAVVEYGSEFLADCEVVNSQFRWGLEGSRSWRDEVVENLFTGKPRKFLLFHTLTRRSMLKSGGK